MDWLSILCDLILPVLGLVLTVLVVPWLRETRAWKYVQLAVRAAEQLFGGGTGPEKYEYVQGLLASKFRLSDDEAQRLIEAAVRELEQVHTALTDGGDQPENGGAAREVVLVGLLSLLGTLVGSLAGILTANKMTNFRLEQLEKKVEKHNNVIERMAVAENAIQSAHHRLDELAERLDRDE